MHTAKNVHAAASLLIEDFAMAPAVKSRLYENTEVRYKNALFFKTT